MLDFVSNDYFRFQSNLTNLLKNVGVRAPSITLQGATIQHSTPLFHGINNEKVVLVATNRQILLTLVPR